MVARAVRYGWRTRVVLALASTVAALAIGEVGLRWLLFGSSASARRIGAAVRRPELFVAPGSDDYWKLQVAFRAPEGRHVAPNPDPRLGWRCAFGADDFAHVDEARIGARRPVLLFGDSYAHCWTGPELCFQALLEQSDLAATHCLLNYGCGAYGLDQILLVLEGAVERFARRDPIVVVGILVDDDLERTPLSIFGWPKPRLVSRAGRLELLEPVETDPERFLASHPVGIASYALTLFTRRLRGGRGDAPAWTDPEARALNEAILDAIEVRLSAHGIERFYLLFCGQLALGAGPGVIWGERLVVDHLRARGLPSISTRPFFQRATAGDPQGIARLFGVNGQLANHYNESGNRVAFLALRQGIEQRFDEVDTAAIDALRASGALRHGSLFARPVELFGRACKLRWYGKIVPIRVEWVDRAQTTVRRVLLRGAADDPTEFEIPLDPSARRLSARIVLVGAARPDCVRVELRAGGRTLFSAEPGSVALPLEVDCADAASAVFVVSSASPMCSDVWVALEDLRFL